MLASGSPRRRELLGRFGVAFEVRPTDVDEALQVGESADHLVRRLALAKAEAALAAAPEADVVTVAADTVVVVNREILGKPLDAADAVRMLRLLSGRAHAVLTGVAVAHRAAPPNGGPRGHSVLTPAVRVEVDVETTQVTFATLSETEIAWYVGTGEPLDKAGGYGIQGLGGAFVTSITGNHDNVVGLSLVTTRRLLAHVGLDPLGPTRPR